MILPISPDDIDLVSFLDELRRWVNIETPSSDPAAINLLVDRIAALAVAAGLVVERRASPKGFGDILAVRYDVPGVADVAGILILAHIDTVHATGTISGALPWRQDGDKLYGPGVYDMKSGVLMALEAMKLVTKIEYQRPIELLIVPDEEIGSRISRPVIEEYARRATCALVVEPARDGGKIVTARKGVGLCDIVIRGRAAHAGVRPADGRSAIRAAAKLIPDIEALNDPARGITVTIGTIRGGTGRNTVPAKCCLEIDLRLPDRETADEVLSRIRSMKPEDPDIVFEIEAYLNRPPFEQSTQSQELFGCAAQIAGTLGMQLEGMSTGGGSDGNFTAALGVPTLDGLGADGGSAHTFDEHILISSIAPRTALLANLILQLGRRFRPIGATTPNSDGRDRNAFDI